MNYSELISKFLSGNANTNEVEVLLKWRNQDPLNEALFRQSEEAWKNSGILNESFVPDSKKGWNALQQKIASDKRQHSLFVQPWMKMAAALVILAGLTWVISVFVFGDAGIKKNTTPFAGIKPVKKEIALVESDVPKFIELQASNGPVEFVLPDSTHVFLKENSRFTYPEKFDGAERPVVLDGEAFFVVTKNQERPFIIYCCDTKTEVTGTSLNVRGYEKEGDVQVSVVEGSVAFSDARKGVDKKIILAANDKVTFNPADATMAKVKSKKAPWWKKGNLKRGWKNLIKRIKDKLK